MDLQETMRELESLGSEQTRKTFLRHGAPGPLFGVKLGDLEKLRKRIKTNAGLAEALWDTGNADARMLATLVADAASMSWEHLDAWARALDWHTLVDVFINNVALRSQHARKAVETWAPLSGEMQSRAGWQLLAALATKTEQLADDELSVWLPRIEQGIHSAQNRVRESMNSALIAIGGRGGALRDTALEVAKRIGKVEVDHGDTACETPDAAEYIERIIARREGGVAKATALAKNAVDSVKGMAAKATAGAQNVASGAMSAVASAKNVMAEARSVVSSAQDAVSDVAKKAAAGAKNVVANARNVPTGAKTAGVAKKAAAGAKAAGAAKKAAASAKQNGAAGTSQAVAKKSSAAGKAQTSAKQNGADGKSQMSAKKNGAAGKVPTSAKKAGAAGKASLSAKKKGPSEGSPAGVKKKGAAKKASPARKAAVTKRAPAVARKAAAKRGAPAPVKRATVKRAAPAPKRASAKKATPTSAKKTTSTQSRTGAKKSARPRT
ncbi:DNA alkylation repair protein [Pyxidicoccus trucidator]|uniref:DNA alkylation repair protein n=1 Tax=Pyxidicoccus trucidator TaxID=2709662 RepID=UPI0013DB99BD|nr:DNA alkylation repair protein [Pyxidicoccus trucidator]